MVDQTKQMVVRSCEPDDAAAWNDYLVRRAADPLFFRSEWDRPLKVYGLTTDRLAAYRDDEIVGVLPLVWQRSLLFDNQLVSLPWFDCCGVLSDDDESRTALVEQAVTLAKQRGAECVQLRHRDSWELSPHVRTDKVLMQLDLPADPEVLWKGFSPKVRNQVRKGEKAGLSVESGGAELLDEFFAVYSENMRDLGSPSHHRRFFAAVLEAFADEATLHITRLENETVGAGLTLANGESQEIPWASSLRRHNRLCVNHVMYWHMLERACEEGFSNFRFGRSTPDSGTYHFKKQWGAQPIPLYWYILPTDSTAEVDVTPPKESYGWQTKLWQKMPLCFTRTVGPHLISKLS